MKCKPLFLKTSHSFEHCSVSWWTGPGFKLTSPESNNNNWEKEFKFLYLSFEIEKWFIVSWVHNDWIFMFTMTEYLFIYLCLLQLFIASFWSRFLICRCKKSSTETIKVTRSLNFIFLLLLNQTFKKKKNKVAKSNHKPFKELLLLLWRQSASLSISVWIRKKTEPDDKLSLELVKNKEDACKMLTKTRKSNIMVREKKQPTMRK